MAYILDQYNKVKGKDDEKFMVFLGNNVGYADRKQVPVDEYDISTEQDEENLLYDECFRLSDSKFQTTTTYYFHCQIQRMPESNQIFNIKLINYNATTEEEEVEQYIKTITISGGAYSDWVDIEFTFTPLDTFDCILFELRRGIDDYRIRRRFAHIAYLELSAMQNFLNEIDSNGIRLLKIGVQSHPSLAMCINGEEIKTCRTGIYELKNGIITINFFSIISGLKFTNTGQQQLIDWEQNIANQIEAIEKSSRSDKEKEIAISEIHSEYITYEKDSRKIDSFTLDYMYRKE